MPNKNKADINSDDIYKHYIKSLSPFEKEKGYLLPKKDINVAIFEVNKRIMNMVIEKNFHFMMPYSTGKICILLRKLDPVRITKKGLLNRAIDFKETNILWKERPELRKKSYIYHENVNTGGFIALYKWIKPYGRLHNGMSYGFNAVKDAKRKLAKELKNPFRKAQYFELIHKY
jgi:hypothetical protein